jgi:hypothetical protein
VEAGMSTSIGSVVVAASVEHGAASSSSKDVLEIVEIFGITDLWNNL